jgi:hypothetical protein
VWTWCKIMLLHKSKMGMCIISVGYVKNTWRHYLPFLRICISKYVKHNKGGNVIYVFLYTWVFWSRFSLEAMCLRHHSCSTQHLWPSLNENCRTKVCQFTPVHHVHWHHFFVDHSVSTTQVATHTSYIRWFCLTWLLNPPLYESCVWFKSPMLI